jgi:hypothetical protein
VEARFVSKGGNFSVGVRDAVTEDYATGKQKVIERHLEAQFAPATCRRTTSAPPSRS